MNKDHYKTALQAARDELSELEDQRAKIDKRISELQQGIVGLSALAPDEAGPQSMMDVLTGVGVDTGLTDATRMITSSFGFPMTPKQVRDALTHLGYDLSGYSNILATLHTTMRRLAKTGELINVVDDNGNELGAYAWNPAVPVRRQKPVSASFGMNVEGSKTKPDLTALGKRVSERLKKRRPEWAKYLAENGGLIVANPPYFVSGKKMSPKQTREVESEVREARIELEVEKVNRND